MKGIVQIAATLPQFILFVFLICSRCTNSTVCSSFFNPKEVSKLLLSAKTQKGINIPPEAL